MCFYLLAFTTLYLRFTVRAFRCCHCVIECVKTKTIFQTMAKIIIIFPSMRSNYNNIQCGNTFPAVWGWARKRKYKCKVIVWFAFMGADMSCQYTIFSPILYFSVQALLLLLLFFYWKGKTNRTEKSYFKSLHQLWHFDFSRAIYRWNETFASIKYHFKPNVISSFVILPQEKLSKFDQKIATNSKKATITEKTLMRRNINPFVFVKGDAV